MSLLQSHAYKAFDKPDQTDEADDIAVASFLNRYRHYELPAAPTEVKLTPTAHVTLPGITIWDVYYFEALKIVLARSGADKQDGTIASKAVELAKQMLALRAMNLEVQ